MESESRGHRHVLTIVLLVCALVVGIAVLGKLAVTTPQSTQGGDGPSVEEDVYRVCKNFTTDQLKAPATAIYPSLAALEEKEGYGFTTFRMLVIIADAKDPLGRMKKLIAATKRAGAGHLLAFTLLPWLLPDPSGLIWFADGMMPTHESLVAGKHHGLRRLEQLARKPETVEEILARERRQRA